MGGLVALIALIGLGGGFIPATAILFAATCGRVRPQGVHHRSPDRLGLGLVIFLIFDNC
jgi:putative tricarboxylic transport membrane protein